MTNWSDGQFPTRNLSGKLLVYNTRQLTVLSLDHLDSSIPGVKYQHFPEMLSINIGQTYAGKRPPMILWYLPFPITDLMRQDQWAPVLLLTEPIQCRLHHFKTTFRKSHTRRDRKGASWFARGMSVRIMRIRGQVGIVNMKVWKYEIRGERRVYCGISTRNLPKLKFWGQYNTLQLI